MSLGSVMGTLLVSSGGLRLTRFFMILDSLCLCLHLGITELLLQALQACSGRESFPVGSVCSSGCVCGSCACPVGVLLQLIFEQDNCCGSQGGGRIREMPPAENNRAGLLARFPAQVRLWGGSGGCLDSLVRLIRGVSGPYTQH